MSSETELTYAFCSCQVITTLPSPSTPCRSTDSRSHLPPLSSLPYNPPLRPALDDTFAHQVDLSLLLTSAVPLFGPEDGKDRGFVEVVKNVRGQEGGLVVFELVSARRFGP
jgi:hypothetical protein